MNVGKHGGGARMLLNAVLLFALLLEAVVCLGTVIGRQNSLDFGIEYEMDPLVLKCVEITNRQDLEEVYGISSRERLYEVCLTFENPAAYTGIYGGNLYFEDADGDSYVYITYQSNDDTGIGYSATCNQIVPAGKSGSMICYIQAGEEVQAVTISEESRKLEGKGVSLTMNLPAQTEETTVWKAEE